MSMAYLRLARLAVPVALIGLLPTMPATADTFFFITRNPDGKIATLSRTARSGKPETGTAGDFVTTGPTVIPQATFPGPPLGCSTPAHLSQLELELRSGVP